MTSGRPDLRAKIARGPIVGTFALISSGSSIEIMGAAGFDFICMDAEHGGLGISALEQMIRAADAVGVAAMVRVAEIGSDIGRVLDLGAGGIVVPKVENAAQAIEVVSRVRYPPAGTRGVGPGRAASYGGSMQDYSAQANDEILVVVQVETGAGVASVAEIAGVPGVDAVMVGPADLAASLAITIGSTEHRDVIDKIHRGAVSAGSLSGLFCVGPEQATAAIESGVRFVIMGADAMFLGSGAASAMREVRAG